MLVCELYIMLPVYSLLQVLNGGVRRWSPGIIAVRESWDSKPRKDRFDCSKFLSGNLLAL